MTHTRISGRCHCGNIRFELAWPEASTDITARECGCSFCQKHRGAWTSHPDARLDIVVANAADHSRYRFGTETADFHVCARCGVAPVVTSDIESNCYAVVNVHAFSDTGGLPVRFTDTDFEGEATDDRLLRRARNWIPRVTLRNADAVKNQY